jgi:hypothetical protein
LNRWWQEGIESQAIDRVNRIGQKKPVHVYQLIAEDTVEAKVLEIQERKKKLVQQVWFSLLFLKDSLFTHYHRLSLGSRDVKRSVSNVKQGFKVCK